MRDVARDYSLPLAPIEEGEPGPNVPTETYCNVLEIWANGGDFLGSLEDTRQFHLRAVDADELSSRGIRAIYATDTTTVVSKALSETSQGRSQPFPGVITLWAKELTHWLSWVVAEAHVTEGKIENDQVNVAFNALKQKLIPHWTDSGRRTFILESRKCLDALAHLLEPKRIRI